MFEWKLKNKKKEKKTSAIVKYEFKESLWQGVCSQGLL